MLTWQLPLLRGQTQPALLNELFSKGLAQVLKNPDQREMQWGMGEFGLSLNGSNATMGSPKARHTSRPEEPNNRTFFSPPNPKF